MQIDHVVLWVDDPGRSVDFFSDIFGFAPVRLEEFRAGAAAFPSVRVNEGTILDLTDRKLAPAVEQLTAAAADSAGRAVNHVCFSLTQVEYRRVVERCRRNRIELAPGVEGSFGACGEAVESTYFSDPDGNVLEIRFYA